MKNEPYTKATNHNSGKPNFHNQIWKKGQTNNNVFSVVWVYSAEIHVAPTGAQVDNLQGDLEAAKLRDNGGNKQPKLVAAASNGRSTAEPVANNNGLLCV